MTDLPPGWISGALSDFIRPNKDKVSPTNFPDLRFIGMDHVEAHTTRIIGSVPAGSMKSNTVRFSQNDVLYGRLRPYLNKVAQPQFDGLASAEFIVFSGNQAIDPAFLRFRLNARDFVNFASHLNEGDRPRVSFEQIGDFNVLVPPPDEQRRIAEKIEALFAEIDKGVESFQTAKSTLDLYRKSLLKSAFKGRLTEDWRARNPDKLETPDILFARAERERGEWHRIAIEKWTVEVETWQSEGAKGPKPRRPEIHKPITVLTPEELAVLPGIPQEWFYLRLSEIAAVNSGMSVSQSRKPKVPVIVPYLRVANVQRGFLDLREIKSMQIEKSQKASLELRQWDVLFNEGGDRDKLGRGWVWERQIPMCITQNHVFRASPFRQDLEWSKYISHWGNSFGRNYFEKGGKQTTNLASVNKTVLKALPVPYCSSYEHAEIVRILDARLEAAARLETDINTSLKYANALRQSILKQAFSGKLVPQDPNDEPAAVLLNRIKAGSVPKKRKRATPERKAAHR